MKSGEPSIAAILLTIILGLCIYIAAKVSNLP
jgi:hypothetical protein